MSEKLYNQGQKVLDEFNKYVEIYKKEIKKIPVIWIEDNNGKLFLYSEYECYSTQFKELVISFGNPSEVKVFKQIEMNEMKYCCDCKHFNCCDDGDDRWDIWCSKHYNINEGKIDLAISCSDYDEERE